jgi:hypothetical protein
MRTTLLVLSTLALVAACANDGTTSPASRKAASNANASVSPDWPPGPGGDAKPISGSSFSTMTSVTSAVTNFDGFNFSGGVAIATCPAGSYVTGGGYDITSGSYYAKIVSSGPFGTNAWRVYVTNDIQTSFKAFAMCVQ